MTDGESSLVDRLKQMVEEKNKQIVEMASNANMKQEEVSSLKATIKALNEGMKEKDHKL